MGVGGNKMGGVFGFSCRWSLVIDLMLWPTRAETSGCSRNNFVVVNGEKEWSANLE